MKQSELMHRIDERSHAWLRNAALLLVFVAALALLSGCVSIKPPTPEMLAQASTCYQSVQAAMVEKARNQPKLSDPRDYAIQAMAEALRKENAFDPCDDAIVAWMTQQGVVVSSANRTWSSVAGLAAIPVGIYASGWAFGNVINKVPGATAGDSYYNSRVVSRSGNGNSGGNVGAISSSGTGLGTANTIGTGAGATAGGYLPRNISDFGDVNASNSNSGDESGNLPPAEQPAEIQPVP